MEMEGPRPFASVSPTEAKICVARFLEVTTIALSMAAHRERLKSLFRDQAEAARIYRSVQLVAYGPPDWSRAWFFPGPDGDLFIGPTALAIDVKAESPFGRLLDAVRKLLEGNDHTR